jgi:hypothetical protein
VPSLSILFASTTALATETMTEVKSMLGVSSIGFSSLAYSLPEKDFGSNLPVAGTVSIRRIAMIHKVRSMESAATIPNVFLNIYRW